MEPPAPATHDEELERRVLGALMHTQQTPERLEEALNILARSDFYYHLHRDTYTAITTIHARGDTPDWLLVSDELHTQGYASVNGHSIGDLRVATMQYVEEVPVAANALAYARDLHTLATRRRLQTAAQRILLANGTGPIDTNEIQQAIEATEAATRGPVITTQPWSEFHTHQEEPAWLVEGLWQTGAFTMIAGAPKTNKTWVALAIAISIASGKPLFGEYAIPELRPVLYVALEGTHANLTTRIGCLARGVGVHPDAIGSLEHLHVAYKPILDLSNQRSARQLADAAEAVDAALIIIDVLRSAARIEENEASQFAELHHNLRPILNQGRSVCLIHHFAKMSDQLRTRSAGERMSGSGAMFGAIDLGIFITSPPRSEQMRIVIESRNDATPAPFGLAFDGIKTGQHGGYSYHDTVQLKVCEAAPLEHDVKAPAVEIAAWIHAQPGKQAAPREIREAFDIDERTLRTRREVLANYGVEYIDRGRNSVYYADNTTPEYPGIPPDPGNTRSPDLIPTDRSAICAPTHARESERSEARPPAPTPYGSGGSGLASNEPRIWEDE